MCAVSQKWMFCVKLSILVVSTWDFLWLTVVHGLRSALKSCHSHQPRRWEGIWDREGGGKGIEKKKERKYSIKQQMWPNWTHSTYALGNFDMQKRRHAEKIEGNWKTEGLVETRKSADKAEAWKCGCKSLSPLQLASVTISLGLSLTQSCKCVQEVMWHSVTPHTHINYDPTHSHPPSTSSSSSNISTSMCSNSDCFSTLRLNKDIVHVYTWHTVKTTTTLSQGVTSIVPLPF